MAVPIQVIHQFQLFQGFTPVEILQMANQSQMAIAKANKTILERQFNLQYLSFVIAGQLQIDEYAHSNRLVSISYLYPGDVLGEVALIDYKPITYSVRALIDTNLLLIPIDLARKLIAQQPNFSQRINLMLAQKIHRINIEKAILTVTNAYHRIFLQIHLLTQTFGTPLPSGIVKRIIPKQQELAHMANTSRETVSRALKMLLSHGILEKNGHQITVKNQALLEKLAQEGPTLLKPLTVELKNI